MDCVFLLYSCMTHNLSLCGCQTLWISPCWVLAIFCILKNILKLYYQSKITWKQFNLLGSCIHERSVYSPLLRQDQFEYCTQCSTNYETFPVWPLRKGTISYTTWTKGTVSSLGLREFPHMYTAEHSRQTLSRCQGFSLCSILHSDILSGNSSCFAFPHPSSMPSPQLR